MIHSTAHRPHDITSTAVCVNIFIVQGGEHKRRRRHVSFHMATARMAQPHHCIPNMGTPQQYKHRAMVSCTQSQRRVIDIYSDKPRAGPHCLSFLYIHRDTRSAAVRSHRTHSSNSAGPGGYVVYCSERNGHNGRCHVECSHGWCKRSEYWRVWACGWRVWRCNIGCMRELHVCMFVNNHIVRVFLVHVISLDGMRVCVCVCVCVCVLCVCILMIMHTDVCLCTDEHAYPVFVCLCVHARTCMYTMWEPWSVHAPSILSILTWPSTHMHVHFAWVYAYKYTSSCHKSLRPLMHHVFRVFWHD